MTLAQHLTHWRDLASHWKRAPAALGRRDDWEGTVIVGAGILVLGLGSCLYGCTTTNPRAAGATLLDLTSFQQQARRAGVDSGRQRPQRAVPAMFRDVCPWRREVLGCQSAVI